MSDISIKDQNNDHKYFTLLQNILSRIGLTAFERSVYWALKECAGEHGSCTKSYAKLAVMAGLSERSLKRTLDTLSEKNKILKKPLIQIINRITECGDRDTNEIVLRSLWNDNIKLFQKQNGEATQTPPQVRVTPPQATQTPQGEATQTPPGATLAYKEEEPLGSSSNKNQKKNPIDKTSSSSSPHKNGGEGAELDKTIFLLIDQCKKLELPFSKGTLLSVFKETSGSAMQAALNKFQKRAKHLKPLDYPDTWLRKNAIIEHEFELQKKEYADIP